MIELCRHGHVKSATPKGHPFCPTCHAEFKKNNAGKWSNNHHPLKDRWWTMLARCYNPNNEKFKLYGGRGITVFEQWRGEDGFINFVEDMFPSFRPGLLLERKDNNGNYEPGNCCWATNQEQINNRRVSVKNIMATSADTLVEFENRKMSLQQIAMISGISLPVIIYRYNLYPNSLTWFRGDNSPERRHLYKGVLYTTKELSLMTGVVYTTLEKRLRMGWSVNDAVETVTNTSFRTRFPTEEALVRDPLRGFSNTSLPEDAYGRMIDNFSCEDVHAASDDDGYYQTSATMYSDDPDLDDDQLLAIKRTRQFILDKILTETDRDPTAIELPRG